MATFSPRDISRPSRRRGHGGRARLLDVHTHRGDFETHTQPKDVFDLFEENNGISVRDILAVGSECEQSVYSLATQELVSQYFEYRQS